MVAYQLSLSLTFALYTKCHRCIIYQEKSPPVSPLPALGYGISNKTLLVNLSQDFAHAIHSLSRYDVTITLGCWIMTGVLSYSRGAGCNRGANSLPQLAVTLLLSVMKENVPTRLEDNNYNLVKENGVFSAVLNVNYSIPFGVFGFPSVAALLWYASYGRHSSSP